MKKYFIHTVLFFNLLIVFPFFAIAQLKTLNGKILSAGTIDRFIHKQMDSLKMPALSIAIINKGKIVYHRTLGVANVDTKIKVDEKSIF